MWMAIPYQMQWESYHLSLVYSPTSWNLIGNKRLWDGEKYVGLKWSHWFGHSQESIRSKCNIMEFGEIFDFSFVVNESWFWSRYRWFFPLYRATIFAWFSPRYAGSRSVSFSWRTWYLAIVSVQFIRWFIFFIDFSLIFIFSCMQSFKLNSTILNDFERNVKEHTTIGWILPYHGFHPVRQRPLPQNTQFHFLSNFSL